MAVRFACMGRIAGVTAAETRERLLNAAADVFAQRGYDGTRVADIAAAAGVSNAALYAHFAVQGRAAGRGVAGARPAAARRRRSRADPDRPITEALLLAGRRLPRRRDAGRHLVVEALVAARRHRDVARLMRDAPGRAVRAGSPTWSGPASCRASSTRRCRPTRSRISACCWRWAARWSRPSCTASTRAEWDAAARAASWPRAGGAQRIEGSDDADEDLYRCRAVPGSRPLLRPGARPLRRGRGGLRRGAAATGPVPPAGRHRRRLAALNCPESADRRRRRRT